MRWQPIRSASIRRRAAAVLLLGFAGAVFMPTGSNAQARDAVTKTMKIRITINGKAIDATLDDTPVARDFASLLPLTLTLTDYASTEKVGDLPRTLSKEGAPAGYDPAVGDITYYAPWGNLAIFYRNFGYARGLIRLGTITSGIAALNQPGPLKATIQIAKP